LKDIQAEKIQKKLLERTILKRKQSEDTFRTPVKAPVVVDRRIEIDLCTPVVVDRGNEIDLRT
jgi:hypothetical protein